MSQRPKRKPLEQFYKEEDDELLEGNHMKLYISYLPIHILFVEETFYHESTIGDKIGHLQLTLHLLRVCLWCYQLY